MPQTLDSYLTAQQVGGAIPVDLAELLSRLGGACAAISRLVALGAIAGHLGSAGQHNVQQEEQKTLDLVTNALLLAAFADSPIVAAMASEELETIEASSAPTAGDYLLLFDPLDGSSNVDVNVSVGTIFSILPFTAARRPPIEADFLQCGERQVAAGYALYGPQTMLVLTVRTGVVGFTLNPADGAWILTHEAIEMAPGTAEFAINMSNQRHWAPPVRRYIADCLAGVTGPRGKDYNMRWVASMVAEVHRLLMRGGVFLYPRDARDPARAGKLRLMYEANPMALLIEQAGGRASDGRERLLGLTPVGLHQRTPVVLGAAEEVEEILAQHARLAED